MCIASLSDMLDSVPPKKRDAIISALLAAVLTLKYIPDLDRLKTPKLP